VYIRGLQVLAPKVLDPILRAHTNEVVRTHFIVFHAYTKILREMPKHSHTNEFFQQYTKYKDYQLRTGPSFFNCVRNQEDARWNQEKNHREISQNDYS
jgi:hypothetical protein